MYRAIIYETYLFCTFEDFILIRNNDFNNTNTFRKNRFAVQFKLFKRNFECCQPANDFDGIVGMKCAINMQRIVIDCFESISKLLI